jgi:hypothetical protein
MAAASGHAGGHRRGEVRRSGVDPGGAGGSSPCFGFLRDLAAAGPREQIAPIAELILRRWLSAHANSPTAAAWRPELWARRIMAWAAHAR